LVGSGGVGEGGFFRRDASRGFRKKPVTGRDDSASMREVFTRRFRHLAESSGEGKPARLPDLIIIDGGKGQLSAAQEVMHTYQLESIPAFALAKGEEWLFRKGVTTPIILPRNSPALLLLRRIRDEAHRFAITYHRQIRNKEAYRSVLDEIPGLGAKRKSALLKHFGSLNGIKAASLEELIKVKEMNTKVARTVIDYLAGI